MALTVEDGTIVSGADSYISQADFIAFALTIGTVVAVEQATDDKLVEAFYYLNSLEVRLKGTRTLKTQPNAYPRDGLVIEDFAWLSTEIPRQVILAQELLTLDLIAGIDLYNRPQSASTAIKRNRVEGVVEQEFAVSDAMKLSSATHAVDVVNSLLKNSGLSVVLSRG